MKQTFKPSPDTAAIAITMFCMLLASAVFCYGISQREWVAAAIGLLLWVLPCFTATYELSLEGRTLVVHRAFKKIRISLGDYDIDFHADDFKLGCYARTWGSGGFWGWWGRWRRLSDGRATRSYLLNKNYNVAVLTPRQADQPIVLVNMPKEWVEA